MKDPQEKTKQIIKEIYQDELAIANLTGNNPNVMYELAIRYCLGKPVLTIAEKGTNLPFDVMPERTIFYVNDPQGSLDLKDAIRSYVLNVDLAKRESPIHAILKEIDADAEALSIIKSSKKGTLPQGSTNEVLIHILNKLDQMEKAIARNQTETVDSEREYQYQCRVEMEDFNPKSLIDEKKRNIRERLICSPFPMRMRRYYFGSNSIRVDFWSPDRLPQNLIEDWLKDVIKSSEVGTVKDVAVIRSLM